MSEQQAFHEAMRADPNDHTTRLVYADWLDDHGMHEPARRIRWWIGAKQDLQGGPTAAWGVRTDRPAGSAEQVERKLPEWVARLNQVRGVRNMWDTAQAGKHPGVLDALHSAELHAYGLLDDPAFDAARTRARLIGPRDFFVNGNNVYHAATGVLRASAHMGIHYPPHDALWHRPFAGNTLLDTAAYDRHEHETQRLADYARMHPPAEPTRLARPLGWIKDKLLGKSAPVRQPGDGIVHKADNPTGVYAEHNAVMQSIRLHGGTEGATPERARQYMNWIAEFVKQKPDHEAVKNYVAAANSADAINGPGLREAVHPLVGAVNLLMSAAGKDSRFVKPPSQALPTQPVHASSAPPYEVVEDQPVDLSDADTAPAEDRHTAVLRLLKANTPREDIVKHLMDAHGAPHRKAALASIRAAINRAMVLHERSKNPTQLAAYKSGTIRPEHLTGSVAARDPYTKTASGFARQLEGTSLAYHLRQIQREFPSLQAPVEAALTGTRFGPSARRDDPFPEIGKALAARGHPLAKAYEWDKITEGLQRDAAVQHAIRGLVQDRKGEGERAYWDMVWRGVGTDRAKNAGQFWTRLENMLGGKHGDREQLRESIHRIMERALDREYLQSGDPEWRDVMGATRTKFQRSHES